MNNSTNMMADTFALVTFTFLAGMFIEVVLSGLTFGQSLQSRLVSIPLNMIVARPYGIYRDWMFIKLRADKKGTRLRMLADMIAFVSFMVPQYIAVLCWVGAEFQQIITACIIVTAMSLVIGRPYGLYMDLCRKVFKHINL